jgi:hypothetical protein
VVPVVVQDPVWEQSFPDVGGVGVPIVDAASGRREILRVTARDARRRRIANEARLRELLDGFLDLQLEAVLLSSSEPEDVLGAFFDWADQRRFLAGREWRQSA